MAGDHIPLRRHSINQLDTFEVSADELDRIESECMDVGQDFQFASVSVTVAISFLIALVLTRIDSRQTFDIFVIVTTVGFVGAAYFGQRYFRKKKSFTPIIQRIRQRQVGPVGESGHELRPAELAEMKPTQAPVEEAAPLADAVAELVSTTAKLQTEPAATDAGDSK
jgi:hypothetical protein